jgi:hypothetical protein
LKEKIQKMLDQRRLEMEAQKTVTSNEVQQPPKRITPIINGQQREYHCVTTVNSIEELDKFRFQVTEKKQLKNAN